jgi:hypothetical protein
MDNNKLLQEFYLLENKSGIEGGPRKLKGIFSEADIPNQNNRIYPRAILERECEKFMKLVRERRAIGELDHPDVSVVQLANASHVITDMYWEGSTLMGEIEILPTKAGQVLEALVNAGFKPGLSSRAVGSTKRNEAGNEVVQEDLQLLTFDVVSNPSVAVAILSENKQIINETKRNNQLILVNSILDDILS